MKNGFLIHGGTRRTATATPFVHEEPQRDTENCNCNTFCPRRATEDHGELQLQHFLSTKSHGGTTENCRTATPFVHEEPRRDHGELQLQHLLSTKGRGGTRRTATATLFVHEGPPRRTATATPFVHEGTRRDGENGDCNTLCPRRDAGDHEENLFLSAMGCEEQLFDPRGAVKERARCLRS